MRRTYSDTRYPRQQEMLERQNPESLSYQGTYSPAPPYQVTRQRLQANTTSEPSSDRK